MILCSSNNAVSFPIVKTMLFFLILFRLVFPQSDSINLFNTSNSFVQQIPEIFVSPRKKISEQDFSPAFVTANCLAYYQFDGNTQDSCSLQQHCSGNGVPSTAGKNGVANTAYSFDLNNAHYLNCGFGSIQAKNIKTIAIWVLFRAFSGEVISKSNPSNGVELIFTSGPKLSFYLMGNTGTDFNIGYPTSNFALNQWYFIVATHNGVGGPMAIYKDGVKVVTGTHNQPTITDAANLIMGNWNNLNRPFNGNIDSALFLNQPLTDNDVTLLYERTRYSSLTYSELFATQSPTGVPTPAPTASPSCQPTTTRPSATPTWNPTVLPTFTPSVSPTAVPSAVPSVSPTAIPSFLPTVSPTVTPTFTPSMVPTFAPTMSPTSQPSCGPTSQPTQQPSGNPSAQPSSRPSEQPTNQPSSRPTVRPTSQPSCRPTILPTRQPSSQPSIQPRSQPTAQPSVRPSGQPTNRPSSQPTSQPSARPSSRPSNQPSSQPSEQPSSRPSSRPSTQPSVSPTRQPFSAPSSQPTVLPTNQPSAQPTKRPTIQPTGQPSRQPSSQPTRQPWTKPTGQPSSSPSEQPTAQPSRQPTTQPTDQPSGSPSNRPSSVPSSAPSVPTSQPSKQPTSQPIARPTAQPSLQPTSHPSSILTISSPDLFQQLVAGTSSPGDSGDNSSGGPTTAAQLQSTIPWIDSNGNIYVADSINHRIRKISSGSIITSFGGTGSNSTNSGSSGPIESVNFQNPYSIVGDDERTCLFISDQRSIWKYAFSTNIVSIVAQTTGLAPGFSGDGAPASLAQLHSPNGLWLTTSGDLYLSDTGNHRIRMISSSNIITTVVGSGCSAGCTGGFSGDGDPATSATLNRPLGVYVNTNGKLFIADSENNRIRFVDTIHIINSFAGTGTAGPFNGDYIRAINANLDHPLDMKGDSLGEIFIADSGNCILRMVDVRGIISTLFGTPGSCAFAHPVDGFSIGTVPRSAYLNHVNGIWVDSNPNVYFSDGNSIHRSVLVSSPSSQPSGQPSRCPTSHPTNQPTKQPSSLPSSQPSEQPTVSPTKQPSSLPSCQPTDQPTTVPTTLPSSRPSTQPIGIPTGIPSSQPSAQPTSLPTNQPTVFPSNQPTTEPSVQPSRRPSSLPTNRPTVQPSNCPSRQPTSLPTRQPFSEPTEFPSSLPSTQPSTQPSSFPTIQPASCPSSIPSLQPSVIPSSQPTALPTSQPSVSPSVEPTGQPSTDPSGYPSRTPSIQPSSLPTCQPSSLPTNRPSGRPSSDPSSQPTSFPSVIPSSQPLSLPTRLPSVQPSAFPSSIPSGQPQSVPSSIPTVFPTCKPTLLPSSLPTKQPTSQPSLEPTGRPSSQPISRPSGQPSRQPSSHPTAVPSFKKPTTASPFSLPPTESFSVLNNPWSSDFKGFLLPLNSFIHGITTKETVSVNQNIDFQPQQLYPQQLPVGNTLLGTTLVVFGRKEKYKDFSVGSSEASSYFTTITKTNNSNNNGGMIADKSSRSVSVLGDINGDSFPDIILGNPLTSTCFVYLGREKHRFLNLPLSFVITSNTSGDFFGWAVAPLTDINNDGADDFMISAIYSNVVYVIHGKGAFPNNLVISQTNSFKGLKIVGSANDVSFGMSISSAGDFNNDGSKDFLISAMSSSSSSSIPSSLSSSQDVIYIIFANHSITSNSLLNDIFIDRLPLYCYYKIIAARTSFAGFSLAGLGDINQDGFDDIIIGSIPYQGGYTSQKSYVLYGKPAPRRSGSLTNNNNTLLLTNLKSGEDWFTITGGGFAVAGPGDVNNDGLNDILIVNYNDWHGKENCYLLLYPQNITSPPTFLPSSQPTNCPSTSPTTRPSLQIIIEAPTNRPSSSAPIFSETTTFPPALTSTLPPSKAPQTNKPTRIPSVKPSTRLPTIKPTSIPTMKPSFRPTLRPSLSPTVCPTVVPSQSPRPSCSPSLAISRFPSSFPSSYPSLSSSTPFTTVSITSNGSYELSSLEAKQEIIISATGNIVVFPKNDSQQNSRHQFVYRIIPKANTITIIDFHTKTDILDLIAFSSSFATWKDLPYRSHPLTIILSGKQRIVLANHEEMDLTEENFDFSFLSSTEQKKSKLRMDSGLLISLVILFLCVISVISLVCLPSGSSDKDDDDEKKTLIKEEPEKIVPLLEYDVEEAKNKNNLSNNNNSEEEKEETTSSLAELLTLDEEEDEDEDLFDSEELSSLFTDECDEEEDEKNKECDEEEKHESDDISEMIERNYEGEDDDPSYLLNDNENNKNNYDIEDEGEYRYEDDVYSSQYSSFQFQPTNYSSCYNQPNNNNHDFLPLQLAINYSPSSQHNYYNYDHDNMNDEFIYNDNSNSSFVGNSNSSSNAIPFYTAPFSFSAAAPQQQWNTDGGLFTSFPNNQVNEPVVSSFLLNFFC
jgi:hypothetical protein